MEQIIWIASIRLSETKFPVFYVRECFTPVFTGAAYWNLKFG